MYSPEPWTQRLQKTTKAQQVYKSCNCGMCLLSMAQHMFTTVGILFSVASTTIWIHKMSRLSLPLADLGILVGHLFGCATGQRQKPLQLQDIYLAQKPFNISGKHISMDNPEVIHLRKPFCNVWIPILLQSLNIQRLHKCRSGIRNRDLHRRMVFVGTIRSLLRIVGPIVHPENLRRSSLIPDFPIFPYLQKFPLAQKGQNHGNPGASCLHNSRRSQWWNPGPQ